MSKRSLGFLTTLALAAFAVFAAEAAAQNAGGPGVLVVIPGTQSASHPKGSPAYGTASTSALSLVAQAFQPLESATVYTYSVVAGNLALVRTGGFGAFEAPFHLPSGALIHAVEFRFCDSDDTAHFASYLTVNDKTGAGSFTQSPLVETTIAGVPGCVNQSFIFAAPVPIDNGNKAYSLEAYLGGGALTALCQARIYYSLQVSPAPAVATFPNDVPTTHPYFRYVEALAAAGITAGTGPGTYGESSPVTRGQMAVFLSLALGLHFPN